MPIVRIGPAKKKGALKKGGDVVELNALIKRKIDEAKKRGDVFKERAFSNLLKDLRSGKLTIKEALKIHQELSRKNAHYVPNGGVVEIADLRRALREEVTGMLPMRIRKKVESEIFSNPKHVESLVRELAKKGKLKPAS